MARDLTKEKNEFARTAYDRLSLFVPKGEREEIRQRSSQKGLSINGYIRELIKRDSA